MSRTDNLKRDMNSCKLKGNTDKLIELNEILKKQLNDKTTYIE